MSLLGKLIEGKKLKEDIKPIVKKSQASFDFKGRTLQKIYAFMQEKKAKGEFAATSEISRSLHLGYYATKRCLAVMESMQLVIPISNEKNKIKFYQLKDAGLQREKKDGN